MRTHLTARVAATAMLLMLFSCNKTSDSNSSSTTPTTGAPSSGANASSTASGAAPDLPPAPPVAIASGTSLAVTIDQDLSTKTNNAGDRFEASLAEPVTVEGKEVLPRGAKITGTVTAADAAGHIKGGAVLSITLDSISVHGKHYSIETSSYEQTVKARGKRTAEGAGGGAAFGAIIGAIAGGGKGAAIGAVAGGGAGTAGTALTGKRDITIPAETRVHFRLRKSLEIPV